MVIVPPSCRSPPPQPMLSNPESTELPLMMEVTTMIPRALVERPPPLRPMPAELPPLVVQPVTVDSPC